MSFALIHAIGRPTLPGLKRLSLGVLDGRGERADFSTGEWCVSGWRTGGCFRIVIPIVTLPDLYAYVLYYCKVYHSPTHQVDCYQFYITTIIKSITIPPCIIFVTIIIPFLVNIRHRHRSIFCFVKKHAESAISCYRRCLNQQATYATHVSICF